MPIGPGAESVGVELYANATVDSRWDRAVWDGQKWDSPAWQSVACEITEAQYRFGASADAGVLSVAEAGALDLKTYDPERLLDPLASGSPFFGAVRPGTPVRLVGITPPVEGSPANPSFEAAPPLAGWTVSAPAHAEQSPIADAPDGAYTLRLIADGGAVAPAVSQIIAVSAGRVVTVSAQTRVAAGIEARLRVDAIDAAGVSTATLLLATSTAPAFAPIGGSFTVPPAVDRVKLFLYGQLPATAGLAVRFDAVAWSATGTPTAGTIPAWTGFIDEGSYELGAATGRLRCVDGIAYLSQAQVPDATVLPNTLRARVRAVVAAVGLTAVVPVEPESSDADALPDPAVSAFDGKAASAWSIIQAAALDALTFVWLGPQGYVRFTPWGSLVDASYAVGCDDGLGGVWLEGLAELESAANADAIRNSVRWYSSGTTFATPLKDVQSIGRYGERRLDVTRVVPNAAVWAQRVLDDRADAGLEVTLGEVRPYDLIELAALLNGAQAGPQALRVRDDGHGELVDLIVASVGGAVGVTSNGWRWRLVTSIPRAEWDQEEPEPPEPPIPPPNPYHSETRTYIATSDALLALTSGGAKYGAGAATSLPVGVWQGWTYRGLIQFPAVPFANVRRIVSATIILRTTTQVRVGFGSSPTVELRRITGSWSAGSASSPSSGNSVVYPGPSVASTAVRANVTTAQGATVRIGVTALVLPWAPATLGGSAAAQRGLALYPGSGSGVDTSEFWPVEQGGASRPTLEVVVEVFD